MKSPSQPKEYISGNPMELGNEFLIDWYVLFSEYNIESVFCFFSILIAICLLLRFKSSARNTSPKDPLPILVKSLKRLSNIYSILILINQDVYM